MAGPTDKKEMFQSLSLKSTLSYAGSFLVSGWELVIVCLMIIFALFSTEAFYDTNKILCSLIEGLADAYLS